MLRAMFKSPAPARPARTGAARNRFRRPHRGAARAAASDLDPGFDGDGKRTIEYGADDFAMGATVQPDGRIVLAGQGDADEDSCERFFRSGHSANLVASWLPALDGGRRAVRSGRPSRRRRLRPRCLDDSHGRRLPQVDVRGLRLPRRIDRDPHRRAEQADVIDRVHFEAAPAAAYTGEGYDLVTMFDCLHDIGDPVGAACHVLRTLAPDGTWMIVEPAAGDRVEDNLNPVGRAYCGFSTLLCTPASLSQDMGLALGAQAGPARIEWVVREAGFTRVRRVAETPVNLVYEARP
jgi:hypothetical protein